MTERKWTPGPWVSEYDRGPVSDWRDKANIGIWSEHKFEAEKIKLADDDDIEEAADESWICGIWGSISDEDKANAHLIAAAPELYDALESFIEMYVPMINSGDCGNWDPEKEKEVISARAALSKARGEK